MKFFFDNIFLNCFYLFSGLRSGILMQYTLPKNKSFTQLHHVQHNSGRITSIKYSKNRTYIAVTDVLGHLVVLHSDSFEIFATFDDSNYFAWHPWNENDFFIGRMSPAKIVLVDLTTQHVNAYYAREDKKYLLNALSLNPLSAELIASFSTKNHKNEILVMASMNRVTDNLSVHNDSVFSILWSPQGLNVATAGCDETLNIWNFFGMSQRKANELSNASTRNEKKKSKNTSKLDLTNAFLSTR